SHSCFGERVNVASDKPAATRASLYATDPIGRTVKGASRKTSHSPRLVSLRLASTTAPLSSRRWLGRTGLPLYTTPDSDEPTNTSLVAGLQMPPAMVLPFSTYAIET